MGFWTAEVLAPTAIGHLMVIDFDHVAENDSNHQLDALEDKFGKT